MNVASTEERRRLQTRIDEVWDYEDPAGTEARIRDDRAGTAPGLRRDVMATQLARALGLQRRFDEARATLGALDPAGDPEVAVRILLERGRVANSAGDPEAARPDFEAAAELAREAGLEFLAVDALHMVAIVAPPPEQAAWHDRAIELAEGADDPRARRWLGSLYNNAGWTRFEAGAHDAALRLFERALEERRATGTAREIATARWAVARGLRAVGRTAEALAAQEALRQDNVALGIDDPFVSEELGECLLELGRAGEARPHLAAAAEGLAADPWLAAEEPDRIARLRRLAGTG